MRRGTTPTWTRSFARVACIALLVLALPQARADLPALDEVEASVRQDGSVLQDLSLQRIAAIRRQQETGQPVQAHALAGLIGSLASEADSDYVEQPARALRKIELGLRLVDVWHDHLDTWVSIVQVHQAKLLLLRWYARGDAADRQRAHEIAAAIDRATARPQDRRLGTFFLGNAYDRLAEIARKTGSGREAELTQLRLGLAAGQAGSN